MNEPLSIPCNCGSGLALKNCCLFKNRRPDPNDVLGEPDYTGVTIYYGFKRKYLKASPFNLDFDRQACCQVLQANMYLANLHNQMLQFKMLQPGDWFVMGRQDGQMKFSFKYSSAEDAMSVAKEKFAAERFLQPPEFI